MPQDHPTYICENPEDRDGQVFAEAMNGKNYPDFGNFERDRLNEIFARIARRMAEREAA